MPKTQPMIVEAFGRTWASVGEFARHHAKEDREKFKRIASRIHRGVCTPEQALELEEMSLGERRAYLRKLREEICSALDESRNSNGKPRFAIIPPGDYPEATMTVESVVRIGATYAETVYDVICMTCGRRWYANHLTVTGKLRRKSNGCLTCGPAARLKRKRRETVSDFASISPPPSVLEAERTNGRSVWEDRMYLQWEETP